jgi:hypothetical protein
MAGVSQKIQQSSPSYYSSFFPYPQASSAADALGGLQNFFLMIFVFQVGLTTFVFFRAPARFQLIQLALLIPGVGILPGIGRFSVSFRQACVNPSSAD